MLASAAFMLGLTIGLRDEMDALVPAMPFAHAETSFYRAARDGIDARVLWPSLTGLSPQEHDVRTLAASLLPVAERGLAELGVDASERSHLLGVIADRIASGQTGARWQRHALHTLRDSLPRDRALTDARRRVRGAV